MPVSKLFLKRYGEALSGYRYDPAVHEQPQLGEEVPTLERLVTLLGSVMPSGIGSTLAPIARSGIALGAGPERGATDG